MTNMVEILNQEAFLQASLDQWKMFITVCDFGGMHAASRHLGRSHSAISHALGKLQDSLGVQLIEIRGRRAVPTVEGKIVVVHARRLLHRATALESLASTLQMGWEAEISVVVDGIVPMTWLAQALAEFEPKSQGTRVRIIHEVKSGAEVSALDAQYDVVLTGTLPNAVTPQPVGIVHFAPVIGKMFEDKINEQDLEAVLQLVVADTGPKAEVDSGWLKPVRRWTVPHISMALELVQKVPSLAILPIECIQESLDEGKILRLVSSDWDLIMQIHKIFPKGERTGPAARKFSESFNTFTLSQYRSEL